MMKRRTLMQLAITGAVAGSVAGGGTAHAEAHPVDDAVQAAGRGPSRFSGSFLQPWLVDSWTSHQWQIEFEAMREVGIDTLILQWTADSGEHTTIYPSGLSGYVQNTVRDAVGETLHWADQYGVNVYLGLNEDGDWWTKYAIDSVWFLDRMGVGRDLVTDIWQRYSHHASLAGWYIALEPWNSTSNPDVLGTLANGFSLVCDQAHALTEKPVMIAPFYNVTFGQTPTQWTDTWATLLAHTQLDIIALQDGVGAAHATTGDLPTWFGATLQAIKQGRPRTRLWSDTETYLIANYVTMPVNEFVADIKAVAPYVEAFTSFSFNHYISPQQVNPAYFATYRTYALTGRLDHTPPRPPTEPVASPIDGGGVHLTWSRAPGDIGVVAYDIYRNSLLLTRVYDTTNYDDPAGVHTDSYQVAAVDAAGNISALSGSVVEAGSRTGVPRR